MNGIGTEKMLALTDEKTGCCQDDDNRLLLADMTMKYCLLGSVALGMGIEAA